MESSYTKFGARQYYTVSMSEYFNPFMVVSAVIGKLDINPRIIKNMDVRFNQDERCSENWVVIEIELNFPMSGSWLNTMKKKLETLLQEAFLTSYGKKTGSWFSAYDKEAPFASF